MDKAGKILLIEDEAAIRRFLSAGLSDSPYQLIEAERGEEGMRLAATHNPVLVLLDLGLPDMDGLKVLERIREWSQVPILVLSARGQEADKIRALDSGANDYLTKPFSVGELLARIRVALRPQSRADGEDSPNLEAGPLRIDLAGRNVWMDGKAVQLTPIEYKLLVTLARNAGRVLTHRQLLTEVWGPAYSRETHYLRVFMKHLRHKLERDPARPEYLTTDAGVGYRFRV
jgi:two-component system KDP operon response regulator KdpE